MRLPFLSENKFLVRLLLLLLVMGSIITLSCLAWKFQSTRGELFGFQSTEMAMAQYTSKHVVGDLGGMKVRIPMYCAEYVEYDGDPGFGEKRKASVSERTFESKLRSFVIDARLPEMTCLENAQMRDDKRQQFLKKDNSWVSIGINAGEIYPKSGAEAAERNARAVINSIDAPTKFWFANYERLQESPYGLEAYVVTGLDPRSGRPAKESENTDDIFIHHSESGKADTYISCSKTNVPGGVASCQMRFGMEPKAQVYLKVRFVRSRLPQWREIRQSTIDFLTKFEVREGTSDASGQSSTPSSLSK